MEPQNNGEARTRSRAGVKDSFSTTGFILGAVVGVFALWGIGRLSGMDGDALKIFYRNSYTVFFGISAVLYYKKIRP